MPARKDPYRGFRFRVEIGGDDKAGFREVSGLDSATDPIDYREGNEKGATTIHKLSGLNKYANITLKHGITDSMDLWKWRKDIVDGKQKDSRKAISIILMDIDGNDAARWNITEAWPTKWTGPTFNATANEVAIDTFELAHEGCVREK